MPKKPFSGKAKKAQLVTKRLRKAGGGNLLLASKFEDDPEGFNKHKDVQQSQDKPDRNRFKLQFQPESKKEIAEKREKAQNPIEKVTDLTCTTEMYFDEHHDLPERPEWKEGWSKERLEMSEQKYFREYVNKKLQNDEDEENGQKISFFELNLETWRQFWRVIEMSDILLLILDIRYATATFPPSLYEYVVRKQKSLILVLNKIDLIPPELSAAWKAYLTEKFPHLHVVFFTSFPSYSLVNVKRNGLRIKKLKANFGIAKEGALQILNICEEVSKVDLSDWKKRVNGEGSREFTVEENESKLLTIGTIGHPNVGKSMLINSLLGKKLVSVSRTPGHTKHFQTIFLTKNVRLCDCPGLVFPSKVPKPLQILMGSFPISQVREPYSVVGFLAERLNLPEILNIKLDEDEVRWSAFGICSAWADLRKYTTARTNRPDTYRAANQILRMALEGKICLALEPPSYDQAAFVNHSDTEFVREVLGKEIVEDVNDDYDVAEVSLSEDEEEQEVTEKVVLEEYPPHKNRQAPPNAGEKFDKKVVYKNPFDALADESD
eukprot:GFUD01019955.1.p1 GENE.GFUD01019955.1~~GFUD01019955.1.p1  ORF type:complete len:549 (-),score=165.75 GFUD01019955.1:56-1702(-)